MRDCRGATFGLRQQPGGCTVRIKGGRLGFEDFTPELQRGGEVAAVRGELGGGAEPVDVAAMPAGLVKSRGGPVGVASRDSRLGRVEQQLAVVRAEPQCFLEHRRRLGDAVKFPECPVERTRRL